MRKLNYLIPLMFAVLACQLDPEPISSTGEASNPTSPSLKTPVVATISVDDSQTLRNTIPPELFGSI